MLFLTKKIWLFQKKAVSLQRKGQPGSPQLLSPRTSFAWLC